jgi:hypothetical protein
MTTARQFLLVSAAAAVLGVGARAQTPERAAVQQTAEAGTNAVAPTFNCSGTVTDAAGLPLAGATVEYWRYEGNPFLVNVLELKSQFTTESNGAFQFQVSRASGILLARKPGLAPAWQRLNQPFNSIPDLDQHLALTPPRTLAGVVVDEADKPVANAGVSAAAVRCDISLEDGSRSFNYLLGKSARDCFAARTDADGRFRIENFPSNAAAGLTVQSPGKVLRQSPENSFNYNTLPWRAGQEDIKLVVEPAGGIEGTIIVEGSNQPPPVARLELRPEGPASFSFGGLDPVESGAEGAFHISDVPAGSYEIHAVFGTNPVPDWVADATLISVESGKVARGVQVTAARGGLLEVAVLGQDDRKPLAQVMVNAYKDEFPSAASTDSNGIALLRLLPGDYQVTASRESIYPSQTSACVEAGQTNRVEIEIAPPRKITGIVRQPDGQPAAGLLVRLVAVFGPSPREVKTDSGGKFELEWNQRQVAQNIRLNNSTPCLLVRDAEHNLAVAQDLDEDAGPLDLKLAPALTLAGRAECDGQPVTNATASLIFWTGNSGMHLAGLSRATNTPGRFEIPAMPPGRKYGILVSAPGYGQKVIYDVGASAEAGRMELDAFELKPANLYLAGQVLDADDKPAVGANVNLSGEGQPMTNLTTDRLGRFRFEQVCEGTVQVSANDRGTFGNISAEGGDTNVVVRLGQTSRTSVGSTAHKLKGTVTDADGKPDAGAQVAVFPSNGAGWTKAAANGAFSLTWSLQPFQMQSGGGALLVARDPARNLAAIEELPEDATNLDVKLKPALTVAGLVRNVDDSPIAGAQAGVWLKAGNAYDQLNEQLAAADAQGRYEIKCLPPDAQYMVFATAKGHGRSQQQVEGDSETNRLELPPLILKLADRLLAGQVLNEDDKPVSGANVSLNGIDQPQGSTTTDSKGRFHFQVCEGRVQLFADSQAAFAQAATEAGDTNVVMTLRSQMGNPLQTPSRAALKGSPLPDLAGVNLAGDAAPAGRPVLLCLFDAGQRSSRHVVQQLGEQAAALRQQGVTVLGVQAAAASDETIAEWQSASPVSFPIGRVTENSAKSKWASSVPELPWLILADAGHRIVAAGFPLDELDAQIKKLAK